MSVKCARVGRARGMVGHDAARWRRVRVARRAVLAQERRRVYVPRAYCVAAGNVP